MIVSEVITRVRRTFGDEDSIQIQDADVIRWINDAQEQIVLENEGLMEATGTASSVANQKTYTLPADLSVLRSLSFQGFHLKAINLNEFNERVNGYHAPANLNPYGPGTPEYYTVWKNEVWLYPYPESSITDAISIFYIKHPVAVVNLSDALSVPLQYHNAIVKYCVAQAYELDENFEAKNMKQAEFEKDTMKLNDRNKWLNQETYPTITTLVEDENYGSYGFLGTYGGGV